MEQKMIAIPFEVEKAKKIQAGEEPGKIVTRDGYNVRIVCWNRKDDTFPIVALIHFEEGNNEYCTCYKVNGYSLASESKYEKDLLIQVPEWAQFKDGSVLITIKGSIFVLNRIEGYKVYGYVALTNGLGRTLSFGTDGRHYTEFGQIEGFATDDEKQQLIDALKASTAPRAKEYLKRFFGIEEKPEQKFEFLQSVLVRVNPAYQWLYGNFTHMSGELHFVSGGIGYKYCIPYNEQTKHLLGTTDDWEEQE